jgi:hypothetical protein
MDRFFTTEDAMRESCLSRGILGVVVMALLLVGGCYVSSYTLGTMDTATVNKEYIGDWQPASKNESTETLVIRNIDGRQYYVELDQKGKTPNRMAGFVTRVKNVDFVQLRSLGESGSLEDQWLIARVGIKSGELDIRQLNEAFFKKQHIQSSDELRKIIESNIDNDQMYDQQVAPWRRVAK